MSEIESVPPVEEQVEGIEEMDELLLERCIEKADELRRVFDEIVGSYGVAQEGVGAYYAVRVGSSGVEGNILEHANHVVMLANSSWIPENEQPMLNLVKNVLSDEIVDGKRGIEITHIQLGPNDMIFSNHSISFRDAFGEFDLNGGGHIVDFDSEDNLYAKGQDEFAVFEIYDEDEENVLASLNVYDWWTMMEAYDEAIALLREMEQTAKDAQGEDDQEK